MGIVAPAKFMRGLCVLRIAVGVLCPAWYVVSGWFWEGMGREGSHLLSRAGSCFCYGHRGATLYLGVAKKGQQPVAGCLQDVIHERGFFLGAERNLEHAN